MKLGIIRLMVLLLFYYPLSSMSTAASMENMQLLGKGAAYYLMFIKVYDASLYSERLVGSENILDNDVSKCLHLQYSVGVDAEDFITAANTILRRQFSTEKLHGVAAELEVLHGGYTDVEEGDSYTLCYFKNTQITSLALNGQEIVAVSSPDFAEIYFSIWLGETEPLDESLREDLLANVYVN